jgi:hypothetical protein
VTASRSIGTYTVTLAVTCGLTACPVTQEAAVAATSCEEARSGVMRVLRYRGWEIGSHRDNRCPNHAAPLEPCTHCEVKTPAVYLTRKCGDHMLTHLTEFADVALDALICDTCLNDWARPLWWAQLDTERAARKATP